MNEIELAEQQFNILDQVPVGVFVLRKDSLVLFWNHCLEDWTGISRSRIVGANIGRHFPHLQEPKYAGRLQNIFEGGPPAIFSAQLHKSIIPAHLPNGQARIQHTTVTAVRSPTNQDFYALFVVQDVTDLTGRIQDYRLMRDQALAEIKERQLAEKALQHRIEFEDLITTLSTHFINLPSDQIDEGINHALQTIGEFLKVDRSYILLFSENATSMSISHEWDAPGLEPLSQTVKECPVDHFPWFAQKIKQFDTVLVSAIADLPPAATAEKEISRAKNIGALVNLPLVYRDVPVGSLAFASIQAQKKWAEEDIALLKIVGEIFVNALERKRAEARLQAYAADLERSNHELQTFAYIASHDLQEPLRKIQLFSNRLRTRHGDLFNEQARDYLERLLHAATRMQTLIQDLLTYSRLTTHAQPFTLVDLNKIASEVLSDLEGRIEEVGGQVAIGMLPTIEADPMQMGQLLQNLISNGLKYHRPTEPPLVKVRANIEEGLCRLTVADNGIGFDETHLERIFRIFERLHGHSKYEGTGIGLAICRKIVDRHGGAITATSAPGQGATFIVTLPLAQSKT
ncbi:MAG: PAS domain S-box protein [Anaerolineae bacterium]|nr:PAS domain S-box protein [Anaerolineae bacterium]